MLHGAQAYVPRGPPPLLHLQVGTGGQGRVGAKADAGRGARILELIEWGEEGKGFTGHQATPHTHIHIHTRANERLSVYLPPTAQYGSIEDEYTYT